jgi:hypothetical protein
MKLPNTDSTDCKLSAQFVGREGAYYYVVLEKTRRYVRYGSRNGHAEKSVQGGGNRLNSGGLVCSEPVGGFYDSCRSIDYGCRDYSDYLPYAI